MATRPHVLWSCAVLKFLGGTLLCIGVWIALFAIGWWGGL